MLPNSTVWKSSGLLFFLKTTLRTWNTKKANLGLSHEEENSLKSAYNRHIALNRRISLLWPVSNGLLWAIVIRVSSIRWLRSGAASSAPSLGKMVPAARTFLKKEFFSFYINLWSDSHMMDPRELLCLDFPSIFPEDAAFLTGIISLDEIKCSLECLMGGGVQAQRQLQGMQPIRRWAQMKTLRMTRFLPGTTSRYYSSPCLLLRGQ